MSPELKADRARIYVSFADEDRARAMELVRWLNDSGWRVVADERHAFASQTRRPSKRLDACDVVLCVVTPGWLISDYCHREFVYCARRGKFILPVICERSAVGLLPPALRALPHVDLTRPDLVDYLTLRDTLNQAGSQIGPAGAVDGDRKRAFARLWSEGRSPPLLLAAAALVALAAAAWLWARS
jgi:hypothetical protein